MENIFLAFGGIIVGVAATILVGRYYYVRSIDKRLTLYIQLASPVLAGIDPEVSEALKINYREVDVVNLFQLQFLIANEGERAIRDCIEPLTLKLPSDIKVLNATILHVHPKERMVKVNTRMGKENSMALSRILCK
jgi:hypothetical protein